MACKGCGRDSYYICLNQGSAVDLFVDCINVSAKICSAIKSLKKRSGFDFLPLSEPAHCKNLAFRYRETVNIFIRSACEAFQAHIVNFTLILVFLGFHRFGSKPVE
jgi:hypothetical protein